MLQSDWIRLQRSWRARAISSVWRCKGAETEQKVSSCLRILLCSRFLNLRVYTMAGRTTNSFYKQGNLYREQRNRSRQRHEYRHRYTIYGTGALPLKPRETLFERPERKNIIQPTRLLTFLQWRYAFSL